MTSASLLAECSPEEVGLSTSLLEQAFLEYAKYGPDHVGKPGHGSSTLPGGVFTVQRFGKVCFVRAFGCARPEEPGPGVFLKSERLEVP